MKEDMTIRIEGLKQVSLAGYPKPRDEYGYPEGVYFLTNDMTFRQGTYDYSEEIFKSKNGLGGESWEKESIIAWNYIFGENGSEDTIKVTILES